MKPVTIEDDEGRHLAYLHGASDASVWQVLKADVSANGRSEWGWLRLANGDLYLTVAPHGDMYEWMTPSKSHATV